jgi:hypothetical protein
MLEFELSAMKQVPVIVMLDPKPPRLWALEGSIVLVSTREYLAVP